MVSIDKLYSLFENSTGVSTDSRNIKEGNLYIGLKGDNFDGNNFAEEAINKGAKYAIVSNSSLKNDTSIFYVENTLTTLQKLAEYHRKKYNIPVIGLTGSNGKTTTKELIKSVLEKKYRVCSTQGNLNNHIGVPLTLLNIDSKTEIALIEMGAGGLREIETLVNIAYPTHGLITNIGKAHLLGFGSLEGVRKTKGELYDHIIAHNGTIFYNSNDCTLVEMLQERGAEKIIPYSSQGVNIDNSKNPFLSFSQNGSRIETQLIGQYNINNILAALCIGEFFNIDKDLSIDAIQSYTPSNNRSQFLKTSNNSIVIDAYNANPVSMEASITNFAKLDHPNKVYILGDMLELGEDSIAEHYNILKILNEITSSNDLIYIVGNQFKTCTNDSYYKENQISFISNIELKEYLKNNPLKGKFILIKGSRGIKLETVIDFL